MHRRPRTTRDAIEPLSFGDHCFTKRLVREIHARSVFRRIAGVRPIALLGEQRRIAQRFQNRLELRMILMDLAALRMIGPGQYKSMGTGGLKNEEVRALHYRLSLEQVPLKVSVPFTSHVRSASFRGEFGSLPCRSC